MIQKEITERCKSILGKTPIDGYVDDIKDFNFLLESFALYPYFDMKTQGQRIKAIQKRKTGSYGTCCFYLIREDGSCTDISYTKMFRKDPQTDDVLAALRTAIDPIISEFRQTFEPFDYEGKHIEKVEDADVDHYDHCFDKEEGQSAVQVIIRDTLFEELPESVYPNFEVLRIKIYDYVKGLYEEAA